MVSPTPRQRVLHMREAIATIEGFMWNMDLTSFEGDARTQGAVLFQFMVIGEAVRHLDPDMLRHYPYPWHLVRAFRNFIAHEYHSIRLVRVYNAANDLDLLDDLLESMLRSEFL